MKTEVFRQKSNVTFFINKPRMMSFHQNESLADVAYLKIYAFSVDVDCKFTF